MGNPFSKRRQKQTTVSPFVDSRQPPTRSSRMTKHNTDSRVIVDERRRRVVKNGNVDEERTSPLKRHMTAPLHREAWAHGAAGREGNGVAVGGGCDGVVRELGVVGSSTGTSQPFKCSGKETGGKRTLKRSKARRHLLYELGGTYSPSPSKRSVRKGKATVVSKRVADGIEYLHECLTMTPLPLSGPMEIPTDFELKVMNRTDFPFRMVLDGRGLEVTPLVYPSFIEQVPLEEGGTSTYSINANTTDCFEERRSFEITVIPGKVQKFVITCLVMESVHIFQGWQHAVFEGPFKEEMKDEVELTVFRFDSSTDHRKSHQLVCHFSGLSSKQLDSFSTPLESCEEIECGLF